MQYIGKECDPLHINRFLCELEQMDFTGSKFDFYEVERGIVTNRLNPYFELTPEETAAELKIFSDNSSRKGYKIALLLDVTGLTEMKKEARKMVLTEEASMYLLAVAFVSKSPIGQLIIGFTIQGGERSYPCASFHDFKSALEWLKSIPNPSLN
jgi:hypothetical protein